MISKKTQEITITDIEQLISLKVAESKTIEYKKEIKLNTDSDKKEFLADVSSFANTNGGDLLFGVDAMKGIPVSLAPIKIADLDTEKLRLENIIRTGTDPRVSFLLHAIPTPVMDEYILLIRINESWNKPHRVIFGGSGKFHARNSAGKYELDVEELRNVFNLSNGLLEKISNFRLDRIAQIESAADGVFSNTKDGKIILHIIPIESFSNRIAVSTAELVDMYMNRTTQQSIGDGFAPILHHGYSHRITANGLMSYSGTEKGIRSSVELYKNGVIEVVVCEAVRKPDDMNTNVLFMKNWEDYILENLPHFLKLQKFLNIQTPSYIFITITGIKGCKLTRSTFREDGYPIEKNILYLPEAILQSYEDDLAKALKPSFDFVWNNAGVVQSPNYDKDGKCNKNT